MAKAKPRRQTMSTLGSRIRDVLEQKGMSQAELARLVGVKQQTIHYLCHPKSAGQMSRHAVKIAEVLGVNPAWLQSGEGDANDPLARGSGQEQMFNVPVIRYEDIEAHLNGGRVSPMLRIVSDVPIGDGMFALQVEGNSMTPLFQPGDKILVDPGVEPHPGDYVVAEVNGTVVFRKYRPRQIAAHGQEYFELSPMNDDFPSVRSDNTDIKILGTVVEHRRYRK